jgi:hypothetical protein
MNPDRLGHPFGSMRILAVWFQDNCAHGPCRREPIAQQPKQAR